MTEVGKIVKLSISVISLSLGLFLSLPYLNSNFEYMIYTKFDYQIIFIILYILLRQKGGVQKILDLLVMSVFLYINLEIIPMNCLPIIGQ